MKKSIFLFALILLSGNFLLAQTWNILDKSMAAWNVNGGLDYNKAWVFAKGTSLTSNNYSVTQGTGYVNIWKPYAAATNNYAFLTPPSLTLLPNTAYTIEVKARVRSIDKVAYPDTETGFESNQISARLNGRNLAIHLKYGVDNEGYIAVKPTVNHYDNEKYKINTTEWHLYKIVFYADNLMYDVYVDDVADPIFENVATTTMTGTNIIRLGAESFHRCNMDVEYVKMGTGAFYSKPKITSVVLSAGGQGNDKMGTIVTIVNTIQIDDNEKLLISLVDGEDNTVVNSKEAIVLQNKATINFTIPAGLKTGKYYIKAAAPGGKIGNNYIAAQKAEYLITTSAFEGKNLATFGNSITAAENSWAHQIYKNLRFGNLYNGAISAAIWYKRERTVAGQTLQTQNYYDPDFAGIRTSAPEGEDLLQHQQRINNCAIVHLQKYFIELDKKAAPVPDVIIFSYGTNDEVVNMGDAESALQGDDLSKVNIFNMAGALRWSIDTLKIRFPDAKIYVALPLQSTRTGKNDDNLKKIEVLKKVCNAKSVPYFDCYNESGITVENSTTYLGDGLHPNEAGKVLHGAYITKKLEEVADKTTSIPSVFNRKAGKKSVSISANVLHASQNLSVTSVADESPLSEVAVYSITGNEIHSKSISSNKYTFQAPTASGIYLVYVKLEDKTSREFKFIVK